MMQIYANTRICKFVNHSRHLHICNIRMDSRIRILYYVLDSVLRPLPMVRRTFPLTVRLFVLVR